MWMHTGYRVPDDAPIPSGEAMVLCCGHYRLQHTPRFRTVRPQGRPDWQLLYVAQGRGRFLLQGERRWVTAGQAVLYRPHEPQEYSYYAADHTEVYWVHFAGDRIGELLERYGLTTLMTVGEHPDFRRLPQAIIEEIQLARPLQEDMTVFLLFQWLALLGQAMSATACLPRNALIDRAAAYFQTHYATPVSISAYARSLPMESGWFTRLFRRQMGVSPRAYLMELRLTNAQRLLCFTDCPVGEVARMVGYEDPLYFSRLFSRRFGLSPTRYRRQQQQVDFRTDL